MLPHSLTDAQRAELKKLGAEYVRLKIVGYAGGHTGGNSMIGGFNTGDMKRGAIEDWLVEESDKEAETKAAEQALVLRWAKIAAWAAIAGVGVTAMGIFIALTK
jgi:hypothetical protein